MSDNELATLAKNALEAKNGSFEQISTYAAIGKIVVERSLDVRNFSKDAPRTLEILFPQLKKDR